MTASQSLQSWRAAFVLTDDARPASRFLSRLFRDPVGEVSATNASEIPRLIDALRNARLQGLHSAGYFSYEAGAAFEESLKTRPTNPDLPLAWFGLFESSTIIEDPLTLLPDPSGAWIGKVTPEIDPRTYARQFQTIKQHIAAGDIYQANLTFQASTRYAGSPLALYAALRSQAQAGHGALIWTGTHWVLSFSPEMFFSLVDGTVTTQPMKGTAIRSVDPIIDATAAEELRSDPKQQAENVMIVDLLRNDLGRVAEPGSVCVPALFEVHTFPTVHQLTSTVTARLRNGLDVFDLLSHSFPCGSVTGAPKISAMNLLTDLEESPRGVYCGSIGHIEPSGDAEFNVAIRTLVLDEQHSTATLGLGSGLVADSTLESEWQECLDKAAFLHWGKRIELVETMCADPIEGVSRLDRHLARLSASAEAFDLPCDVDSIRRALRFAAASLERPSRIRLVLSTSGFSIETGPLPVSPLKPWSVRISPLPVDPDDFRLRHKTTDRGFLDLARDKSGADEVVFVRPDGLVTEGSITALFVPRDGVLLTPRLRSGLLDSVLRRELIETGQAVQADLTEADLGRAFLLGNSLRGLIEARLIS